ncbi:MAG: hypothetical protein ACM3X7_01000 [Solirubrobacterales bacterium]
MRGLICIKCGKKYFTSDTTTPASEIPVCENCGGNLDDITDEEIN